MPNVLLLSLVLGQMTNIPYLNRKPEPFVAPGRLFSIAVPKGWGVALHDNDPYTIDFKGVGRPGNAILQVRRIVVPRGAQSRQLLLNSVETRLSKLPNFKVYARRDIKIAGRPAAAVIGAYAHQGNVQFPVAVEEVYVVVDTEAFVFHFECFEPAAAQLARELNQFYKSFKPRPAGATNSPFGAPDPGPAPINPRDIRY